jgi:hypothetical protein
MITLRIITTFMIVFIALVTGLVARDIDAEDTTALVGMGVLITTDILSLICIWG